MDLYGFFDTFRIVFRSSYFPGIHNFCTFPVRGTTIPTCHKHTAQPGERDSHRSLSPRSAPPHRSLSQRSAPPSHIFYMASLTPSGSCSDPVISRAFIISVRFLCGGQQYQHATKIQQSQETAIPTRGSIHHSIKSNHDVFFSNNIMVCSSVVLFLAK